MKMATTGGRFFQQDAGALQHLVDSIARDIETLTPQIRSAARTDAALTSCRQLAQRVGHALDWADCCAYRRTAEGEAISAAASRLAELQRSMTRYAFRLDGPPTLDYINDTTEQLLEWAELAQTQITRAGGPGREFIPAEYLVGIERRIDAALGKRGIILTGEGGSDHPLARLETKLAALLADLGVG